MPLTSSAPESLSFTFYGVIESIETEFPSSGAAGFGFAEGEAVTAHFAVSGDTAAAILAAVGSGPLVVPVDLDEVDLFVPMPWIGDWDERYINGLTGYGRYLFVITIDDLAQPPAGLSFILANDELQPDGPNGRVDQSASWIRLWDDNDNEAAFNGLWVPDGLAVTRTYGGAGDDVLRGWGEFNLLWGLEGDDHIMVKAGVGYAWAGDGDDTIKGEDGDDALVGWTGDDKILGRRGDDKLFGNEGNDLLRGEPGDDVISGGRGMDSLKGGSGDDVLSGGDDDDILYANDGSDSLDGGFGADLMDGGSGDDVLRGSYGDDRLDGGPDDDLFLFDAARDGLDTIVGFKTGAGSDDVVQIENFSGGFDALMAAAYDSADGAVFVLRQFSGSFYGLEFSGRAVADFHPDDFQFV